jgi:uncharacterized protein YfaP (DUF2135 family)
MIKKTVLVLISLSLAITMITGCGVSGGSNQTTTGGGQTTGTGHVSLAWDAPTTYVDGTPISGPIGYKVYYGTSSGAYTYIDDVHTATSWSVNTLTHGTWYFEVTCYDSNGSESDFSNEISTTI